jgi:hypothetical protein
MINASSAPARASAVKSCASVPVRRVSGTTGLFELIENHLGKAFVKVQQAMQVQVPMMQPPSPSNP